MDGITRVREFNRTVTERIGALDDHYLARGRPLGQSRLLWEIGAAGDAGAELRDLRERLGLDSGYLSRQLRASASGESVDLGAPAELGGPPLRVHPAATFQPVERRVERPVLDEDRFAGHVLDESRNRVAMARAAGKGLENQRVESAMEQRVGRLVVSHAMDDTQIFWVMAYWTRVGG